MRILIGSCRTLRSGWGKHGEGGASAPMPLFSTHGNALKHTSRPDWKKPGVYPGASAHGATVSIDVPLLFVPRRPRPHCVRPEGHAPLDSPETRGTECRDSEVKIMGAPPLPRESQSSR